MKEIWANIRDYVFWNKNLKRTFLSLRNEIQSANFSTMLICSLLMAVLFTGLCAASLMMPVFRSCAPPYALGGICCTAIYIFVRAIIRKPAGRRAKLILPLQYILYVVFFAVFAVLGIHDRPDNYAVTFCVLLFVLPLLIIDRPYRIGIFTAIVTIAFCLLTWYFKNPAAAATDILDAVSFSVVGSVLAAYMNGIKLRDMTNRRMIEQERDIDAMTGLYNRRAFNRDTAALEEDGDRPIAVLFADLNCLKHINDTQGHAAGDEYIVSFADNMLKYFIRSTCYRISGDEFVVVLSGLNEESSMRYMERFAEQIRGQDTPQASVGYIWQPDSSNLDKAVSAAEQLMYKEKDKFTAEHPNESRK